MAKYLVKQTSFNGQKVEIIVEAESAHRARVDTWLPNVTRSSRATLYTEKK